MMVSVDGYTGAPNRDINWHVFDEQMAAYMMLFFDSVDTFLYGRVSYELMLKYWPNESGEFAEVMNTTPKIVFSKTLDKVEWNSRLVKDNVKEEVLKLKKQPGKNMALFAGADIAATFMKYNLIDEYHLIVNPVVLGKGTPLFKSNSEMHNLKLLRTRSFDCGNVVLQYQPTRTEKNEIRSEVVETVNELFKIVSSLNEKQLNFKPSEESWSAGQVADHLIKSYGAKDLLMGKAGATQRAIDENVDELKDIFLDFDTKLASPEFILPTEERINKEVQINKLQEKVNEIIAFSEQQDLADTCLDFEFPGIGYMTKLEWLHFFNYHTQRHIRQIKGIIQKEKMEQLQRD